MTYKTAILGSDGRVGSVIVAGLQKEGWSVTDVAAGDVPAGHDLFFDCGPAGTNGYDRTDWPNYFGAVERAVQLIARCEAAGYKLLMICATPWIALRTGDPYSDSKALIEHIAQVHNRHGKCFVLVDRVGMQDARRAPMSRFEASLEQREGMLAERVIASTLHILEGPAPVVEPGITTANE